ncbi:uncharacterized protein NEMAJ01_0129 [Nematocida major]|uniref:uncharacterized protein n=1 Tax=Nematocida major TaxID=1912982 RepID=UPI002007C417|nr:uncharacterized protein NEMAJ01_0129 [Nematocida major]KAH9385233.1 hypothetical protein NEMAJ01_0129 [Nematocida major]
MEGIQHRQPTDANLHKEIEKSILFTVVEIIENGVIISKGNATNRWPLRKRYISFATNEHLLKRGAFIGLTPEGTLFLVRYLKGREDALVGMVEYYALFDTTIVYISGKVVTTIDICTGEKKMVIENDENIGIAKVLLCGGSLLLVCRKAIHRLEIKTSLYTKLRLKVSLDANTAEAVFIDNQVQLVVSCRKGNVYVFETKKMEIIKSMKYFGSPICTVGFWRPEPSILFVLTTAGDLMDVDYLNNRILKTNKFPIDDYRSVVALKGKAMIFISSNSLTVYSPHTNSINTVYRSHSQGEHSYICVVPDEGIPIPVPMHMLGPVLTQNNAPNHMMEADPIPYEYICTETKLEPSMHNRASEAHDKIHAERPVRLDVEYSQRMACSNEAAGAYAQAKGEPPKPGMRRAADLHESFENFKDSVYKMQTDVLKEVFLLKKRLEKIERALSK